jgi:hypothetical protein
MKRKPNAGRGLLFLGMVGVAVILILTFSSISAFGFVILFTAAVVFLSPSGRENVMNDIKALSAGNAPAPSADTLLDLSDASAIYPALEAMVYSIKLPPDTIFQADKTVALIQKLITLRPLILRIHATSQAIVWQVFDLNQPPCPPDVVAKAIHTVYLDAEVSEGEPYEERPADKTSWRMVEFFGQVVEFPCPILYADAIGKIDPLTLITNTMSSLEPGESVSYSVYLGEFDEGLHKQGEELITHSKLRSAIANAPTGTSLSEDLAGMAMAAALSPILGKRRQKYDDTSMRAFYEKMNGFMFYSAIAIEANASRQDRLETFDFQPALLQFRSDYQLLARQPCDNQKTSSLQQMHELVKRAAEIIDSRKCVFNVPELAALWHLPHQGMTAREISWIKGRQVAAPSAFTGKRAGVFLGNNCAGGRVSEIYQPASERTTHTLVLGKTGVGKTSFMQALVAQDIEAGRGVAVVDPLGSFVRRILQHHIPVERENDVVILDIDYEFDEDGKSVRYPPPLNLLARPHDLEDSIAAGNTVSVLSKIYADFEATGYANMLTNAIIVLMAEKQPTLLDIENVITDLDYRTRLLAQVDNLGVQRFWSRFNEQSGSQQSSISAALRRLDPFYSNPHLSAITCHPDPLDFERLMGENKIILVSVHADEKKVPELQRNILGATVVSQLQMAALAGAIRDPKNRPYLLYVDEVQEFVTTSLDQVARQARQKGLGLIVATQYLKSLAGKTLDAFLGTIGTICAFECEDADARIVLSQMRPFEVADLAGMGKYRAVVSMRSADGTNRAAFNLEPTNAPDVSKEDEYVERELYLRRLSVKNYTPKPYSEVKEWLNARYNPQSKKPAPQPEAPKPADDFSDPV